MKKELKSEKQKSQFITAIDKIADIVRYSDDHDEILESANQILGETLDLDRALIYYICFDENYIQGLCEWLKEKHQDIEATKDKYPLDLFKQPFTQIKKTQHYLTSHINSVNKHFVGDGSGEMLHGHFKIKSLIWYPFDFDGNNFYVFTLNQILNEREWSEEELNFVGSVAKQVSLALMKIKLTNERQELKENEAILKANEQQLRASNQQIAASEEELRAANQQLSATEQQLRASEKELQIKNDNLTERLKEIDCLYKISKTIRKYNDTERLLANIVKMIPPGWHYPQITVSRIIYQGNTYESKGFRETKWKQSVDLFVEGKKQGVIEVFYLKEKPVLDEGPFLKEERNLINSIAGIVGGSIERILKHEGLQSAYQHLQENEQQLEASENKIRSILNNSPFPVAVVDTQDENILFWSNSAIEKFGHHPKTTEEWYKLAYPDPKYRNEVIERWKAYLNKAEKSDQTIYTGEYNISCKDGSVKICELYAQFIANNLIVTLSDVSERKQAEEEITKNLEVLTLGEKIANLGYFERNWQTGKGFWSKGFYDILGVKPENLDCTHEDFMKFIHPEDINRVAEHVKTTLTNKTDMNIEFRLVQAGGNVKNIQGIGKNFYDKENNPLSTIGTFQDISKRKQAEKALHESERRLLLATKAAGVGIWDWDIISNDMMWDERIFEMYGITNIPEEISLEFWQNCLHPDDREFTAAECMAAVRGEKDYDVEFRVQWSDGTIRWMKGDGIVLRNDKGEPIRMIGTNYDITERIQADEKLQSAYQQLQANEQQLKASNQQLLAGEQQLKAAIQQLAANEQQLRATNQQLIAESNKLKASEEELNTIFNTAADGMRVIGTDFSIKKVNDTFCEMIGLPRENIIGEKCYTIFSGEFCETENCPIHRLQKNGEKSFEVEMTKMRPDGKEIATIKSVKTLTDEQGKFIGIVEDFKDISERKESEEEIKRKERDLRSLVENPAGYIIFRNRLNRDTGQIDVLQVSPSFNDVLGISEEDKYNFANWFAYVHQEDLAALVKANDEGMKPPFKLSTEIRYNNPQKGLRWLEIRSNGIPYEDDPEMIEYANGMILDITERKKAEEELIIAKEKAEESDRLKSAFLANMSHEIRTPMNGILGFTNLLSEPDFSIEKKNNFISIIKKSGERLINTLNDIIEISKIEVGEYSISKKKVNIKEKVSDIISFFITEAKNKGLDLKMDLPPVSKNDIIETDESKFESILTNLIKNAIKYSEAGTITFGYNIDGDKLKFFCKDEGMGIPTHRQEAIFNRFEQADIKDTRGYEGSGLGLAITKAYVEMLGGEISVESEGNKGSTFYFTLPCQEQDNINTDKNENEINISLSNDISNRKLNILVVEDDETAVSYLRIVLDKLSEKLYFAKTGKEAVEMARTNTDIDLILMDIKLPVMNGYEATMKIREFNKEVKIIAQTAYGFESDHKKAIEAGCNDYIAKPLNKEKLIKLINKQLGVL